MPYCTNSNRNSAIYTDERNLLLEGFSYLEISEITGARQKTISERNRLIHKVDIFDAFAKRCKRNGIPTRLPTNNNFCSWFSGFFDGEGCIVLFTRPCTGRPQYSEYRLQVRIQIREDDNKAIHYITDNIGCGIISTHNERGTTRSSVSWNCEKITELAEIIVPIFDNYPLQTKKAKEYAIWKPLVIRRYIDTLGGHSNRKGIKADYDVAFKLGMEKIKKIRH
jgi:hypothetical protein